MEIRSIQKFNLINSIALISMSAWGYIDTNSFTALIPAFFGVLLFILGTMLTNEKLVKLSAHLLVLFTLLILLALIIQVLPGDGYSSQERLWKVPLRTRTSPRGASNILHQETSGYCF